MSQKSTTRKRIGKEVKDLFSILKANRITAKHPFVLTIPVTIQQTIDGRGLLDFAYETVKRLWHDRTTVVIETTNGEVIRLVDSYETSGHYYLDSWWNIKELKKAFSK